MPRIYEWIKQKGLPDNGLSYQILSVDELGTVIWKDNIINWNDIINKPTSTVTDIDDAVSKKHEHSNKTILDNMEESFTTVLKTKLDGLEKYTHPVSHSPSIIIQDDNNRFVTDIEKTNWNNKANSDHTHIDLHTHTNKIILDGTQESFTTILKTKLDTLENYIHPISHSLNIINETDILKIMTLDERNKLLNIENNANNYTHPLYHSPNIIEQDTNNRFVTDTEKSTWNSKAADDHTHDDLHTHTNKIVLDKITEDQNNQPLWNQLEWPQRDVDWSEILNIPTSTTLDIDDAVSKKHNEHTIEMIENLSSILSDKANVEQLHTHINFSILNNLSDISGVLHYLNLPIGGSGDGSGGVSSWDDLTDIPTSLNNITTHPTTGEPLWEGARWPGSDVSFYTSSALLPIVGENNRIYAIYEDESMNTLSALYMWKNDAYVLVGGSRPIADTDPVSMFMNQETLLNVVNGDSGSAISSGNPKTVALPIAPTEEFKLPKIEVLKFTEGSTDVSTTLFNFDPADATNFVANDAVIFDGTLRLKDSFEFTPTDEIIYEDAKVRTVTFDATQFVDVFSISM